MQTKQDHKESPASNDEQNNSVSIQFSPEEMARLQAMSEKTTLDLKTIIGLATAKYLAPAVRAGFIPSGPDPESEASAPVTKIQQAALSAMLKSPALSTLRAEFQSFLSTLPSDSDESTCLQLIIGYLDSAESEVRLAKVELAIPLDEKTARLSEPIAPGTSLTVESILKRSVRVEECFFQYKLFVEHLYSLIDAELQRQNNQGEDNTGLENILCWLLPANKGLYLEGTSALEKLDRDFDEVRELLAEAQNERGNGFQKNAIAS